MAHPVSAAELIRQLQLLPHPEGGHFRETYRSSLMLQTPWGPRSASTAIHYLLRAGEWSCWHRLRSDEAWHHHDGGSLLLYAINPDGNAQQWRLGLDLTAGERPQHVVPAGSWFAATPAPGSAWSLLSCTVAPGFDFADFEVACETQLPGGGQAIEAICPHWRRFLAGFKGCSQVGSEPG
ncbi:MAG: cupin domain-containing protein [Synechococcus sp.]|nr:cupin domain-containing protein [Synechococcus sp.]